MEWPLLRGIPDADRARFLDIAHPRHFARGEMAVMEGAPADALHLVVSGRFAVRAGTETGDSALLALLGPGDFFGELALLQPVPERTASVTALEGAQTLAVYRAAFGRLRAEHPSVDQVLVNMLAAQVRRLSSLLVEAMYSPAEARLYRRLLDAAEHFGGAEPGTVIPLTQEDIAGLAGTTRPTANRALRQAEQKGLLAIGRGRVELLDPNGLADLARS